MFDIICISGSRCFAGAFSQQNESSKGGSMPGLDGRHRNKDGRIEQKRADTKIKNLKPQHPELKIFPDNATLGEIRARYSAESLDGLLRAIRKR